MITETGKLDYGLEIDGVRHTDFEMRSPTIEDMECALEAVPEGAGLARIRRHLWARCLTRLGNLSGESITPQLLAGLAYEEYSHFAAAEERLKKKLTAGSGQNATSA